MIKNRRMAGVSPEEYAGRWSRIVYKAHRLDEPNNKASPAAPCLVDEYSYAKCRPIRLISTLKNAEQVVDQRLREIADRIIIQCGFVRWPSMQHIKFVYSLRITRRNAKVHMTEFHLELYGGLIEHTAFLESASNGSRWFFKTKKTSSVRHRYSKSFWPKSEWTRV